MARKKTKPGKNARERKALEQTDTKLLKIVRDLALELRPHLKQSLPVNLDSDLDDDIGLDSLGRAELLLRVDRSFKVRLPETLIADARTPRDIRDAILATSPAARRRARPEVEPMLLPETGAPASAATVLDVLAAHVEQHGDRPHLLLWSRDEVEEQISYGELDHHARSVCHGLLDIGLQHGDRVAIMLPTEPGFFYAFFGILMAGGVPVPIYPPFRRAQVEDHLRRQAGILRNAGATFLITEEEIRQVGRLLYGLTETMRKVVTVAELVMDGKITDPIPADADTTALIQYTSGSTGDPKGVVLSHRNLLANVRAMGGAMQAKSTDIFVSWLPLYHDMGLIGAWLGSLYFGVPAVIMPPLAFLANPSRWLWAIHHHRATLTAAPNFAFELCLKNIRDEDIKGLDLSSLRMALNGAEPVSPATIESFSKRFKPFGFRADALAPVYGLAECSVGLAFPPPERLPIIDEIDREAFSRLGEARKTKQPGQNTLRFVACGQPLSGHEIRIVDETGLEVPERREGRLQFKGPSATREYFRNPAKTRDLFDGDWLESGDRAYIAGGDVFLTGRIKDIIIRGGRNIYPHELEEFVGGIEGVRRGCVAAFPSTDPRTGTERLILLAETRYSDEKRLADLASRISKASTDILDMPPDDIVLGPPRSVPKTSSGKIRRSQARALYESGVIGRKSHALWWQLTKLGLLGLSHRLQRGINMLGRFAYAAWFWAVLAILAIIGWPLVVALPGRSAPHRAVSAISRLFFRLVAIPVEFRQEGEVPPRNVILVSNHASYLDSLAILSGLRGPTSFVAKEELARQLIAGPFLRRLGTLFVRRTDVTGGLEDTATILEAVKAGERVLSFPEGTFTRMPGILGFHVGPFLVAAQTGTAVMPLTIRGTRSILRGGQWFPRRGPVSIRLGKAVAPDGDDFAAAVRLRDTLRATILERSQEPDLAHEKVSLPTGNSD